MSFNDIIKKHLQKRDESVAKGKNYKFKEKVFYDVYNLALTEAGIVAVNEAEQQMLWSFAKLMFEYGQKYEKNF